MRPFSAVTPMLSARSPVRALLLPALAALALSGCGGAAGPNKSAFGPHDEKAKEPPPPPEEAQPSFLRVGAFLPPDGGDAATAAAPPITPITPAAKTIEGRAEPSAPHPPADDKPRADLESAGGSGGSGKSEHKSSKVQGAVVDSQGGLSEADVRAAISSKHTSFRRCYDLGKAASADFSGNVVLRVSISPAGNVASVDILSSTTRNAVVDGCVRDEVRVLQFKASGAGAVVAFPLEFAPR